MMSFFLGCIVGCAAGIVFGVFVGLMLTNASIADERNRGREMDAAWKEYRSKFEHDLKDDARTTS
jgi:hypothetical protein